MQIMTAAQVEPTKITQSLPEGDVSIVACIDGSQWGNNTCDGVAISIGFYQFAEQLFDNFPGIGRGISSLSNCSMISRVLDGGLGQFSSILRRLEITLVILNC